MTRRLIIYLDETWPSLKRCPWVVIDNRNNVIEQGESGPDHWPSSDHCELVLGGAQGVLVLVRLPPCSRRDEPKLLRFAAEEHLIGDIDAQHLTIAGKHTDAEGLLLRVLAVEKSRLKQILADFAALGHPPARVHLELQHAHPADTGWAISIGPTGHWMLRTPQDQAIALKSDVAATLLPTLLNQAYAQGQSPASLTLARSGEAAGHEEELSALEVSVALKETHEYRWWLPAEPAADLLHGDFATSRAQGGIRGKLKGPAVLAALALLVLFAANTAEIVWKSQQLSVVEDRMQRLFETAVPNTPAVAPALQLKRALNDARARQGQLGDSDFLRLLDVASESIGAGVDTALQRFEYRDGVLSLYFNENAHFDIRTVIGRLRMLGFSADLITGESAAIQLSAGSAP